MAERHGIFASEVNNSVITAVQQNFTLTVAFGTAPINLTDKLPVNTPVLCNSYEEAVNNFGYSNNWDFTLSEVMHSHFKLYKQSPIVLINVLDPNKHVTEVTAAEYKLIAGLLTLKVEGILKDSIKVKSQDDLTAYERDKDYTLTFDKSGYLVIATKQGGSLEANSTVKVAYSKLDSSKVTSEDVIGGTDASSGKVTGLELLNKVMPRLGLVPGIVSLRGSPMIL